MLAFAACSIAGGRRERRSAAASGGSAAASADTVKGHRQDRRRAPATRAASGGRRQPIINGIKLAVKQAGGGAGGYKIEIPLGRSSTTRSTACTTRRPAPSNMTTIVTDADIVAVIGPLNSSVALAQIPITNEARPAPVQPGQHEPGPDQAGVRRARRAQGNPDRINYVRVVTTDDIQGPAAAQYILENLEAKNVYIIDDTETFGKGIADTFEAYFEANGGTVVERDGAPKTTTDYIAIMTAAKAKNPEAIYFGGVTATGGARILKAAVQAGLATSRTSAPTASTTAPATTKDSFLNLAGAEAKNSYATAAAIGDFPGKAEFDGALQGRVRHRRRPATARPATPAPRSSSTPSNRAARQPGRHDGPPRGRSRRGGRPDRSRTTTVLGDFTFDANGDTSQKIISFYAYDPPAPTARATGSSRSSSTSPQ